MLMDNFVQVPLVALPAAAAELNGKALPDLQSPPLDGLMADFDPAGGEHLLDYAQAEPKSEVQPHGMADHLSRNAVAGLTRMAALPPINLTGPSCPNANQVLERMFDPRV
jgi:hypothetical protein